MIKVSIILPIYNVEEYLEEALYSILKQSLRDIEIIAVNDGSTDNSGDVLRRIQAEDSRIKCFSQKNKGLSATRNVAMRHARGEYIYFMDSDDILKDIDALKICYNYAESTKADFLFFDGDKLLEQNATPTPWDYKRTYLLEENLPYSGKELLNLMLDKQKHRSVVWLLFIRKKYLKKINLQFYEGIIHEDELFTTILTLSSDNIFCLKRCLVGHRIRQASIMGTNFSKRNLNCYLTVADELLKFSKSPIIHKFLKYTLSKVFYTGHVIPFRDKLAVFGRAMKSGYLKYIGMKSILVFWIKRN